MPKLQCGVTVNEDMVPLLKKLGVVIYSSCGVSDDVNVHTTKRSIHAPTYIARFKLRAKSRMEAGSFTLLWLLLKMMLIRCV